MPASSSSNKTPEARYVSLHHSIERGHPNDDDWGELSRVCFRLGYLSEAVSAVEQIANPNHRYREQMYLSHRGVMDAPVKPKQGPEPTLAGNPELFKEEVGDSVQFLFQDHMPSIVMAATLTFLLVVGGGGMIAASAGGWLATGIVFVPIVLMAGMIGAMARQILLEANHGLNDAPRVPRAAHIFNAAVKSVGDFTLICLATIGPPLIAMELGLTTLYVIPILFFSTALIPMAFALCMVRNDRQGMAPKVLFRGIFRCGGSYAGLVIVTNVMMAPAILALAFSGGSDFYLRIAFVGPLAIAPLFILSRLTGRILRLNRLALGDLIVDRRGQTLHEMPERPRRGRIESIESSRVGADPGEGEEAGIHEPSGVGSDPAVRREDEQRSERPSAEEQASYEEEKRRRHAKRRATLEAPAHPETRPEVTEIDSEQPDLSQFPGAKTVSGDARRNAGATSDQHGAE